jgi:hypothetical protein
MTPSVATYNCHFELWEYRVESIWDNLGSIEDPKLKQMTVMLTLSLSWSKSICDFTMDIMRSMGLSKTVTSLSKVNTLSGHILLHQVPPQEQVPRFSHSQLKMYGSPRSPTMIGWAIVVGCTLQVVFVVLYTLTLGFGRLLSSTN